MIFSVFVRVYWAKNVCTRRLCRANVYARESGMSDIFRCS